MIITDTSVFNFDDLKIQEDVHIVIEKNTISQIISKDNEWQIYENIAEMPKNSLKLKYGEVVTGRNRLTISGLTNCHSHTAMTLLRGSAEDVNSFDWFNKYIWLYEKNLEPEDVYWGTLLGAAEMLLSGVTFVCDHYFAMDMAFKAYTDAGIRADLGWAVFGQGDNWEKDYKTALDFTEKYRDKSETITVSLAPHSPYICPKDFLIETARYAEEKNLKTHIHVSEEPWQVEKSLKETGKTPVEYLADLKVMRENSILAHAYYATDSDLTIIKEYKSLAAHAPKTYMKFGFLNDFLPRALDRGVRVALASDGPASNSNLSIFEAARDAALLAKLSTGDPEKGKIQDILPLLSSGYSLIDGLNGERIGRVETGYKADLVLLNRNSASMNPEINIGANILYSLSDRDIDKVIVNGSVVADQGRLLTINLENVCKNVNRIKNRMITTNGPPMQTFGV